MNSEFHYYAIHFLALRAGFDSTSRDIIATSSQLVDECQQSWTVTSGGRNRVTPVTQAYRFWDEGTMRDILMPFHFIPAGSQASRSYSGREDYRHNPFSVQPDSPLAKEVLVSALKSRDLHRVGIALHAYADTWAHQNFSAQLDEWNRISGAVPLPAAGHAQALTWPDELTKVWTDDRLIAPEVVNRDRFLQAASKIYKYLRTFNSLDFADTRTVLGELASAWGKPGAEPPRAERQAAFISRYGIPAHSRLAWVAEAGLPVPEESRIAQGYGKILELGRRLRDGENARNVPPTIETFPSSRFFKWCEAAEAHRKTVAGILSREGL